jgi:mRNA interferase YafQ
MDKIRSVIDYICEYGDAPEECRPHNLVSNWSGYRECHIEPDWLLIYVVESEMVSFYRTGTHSDLFR